MVVDWSAFIEAEAFCTMANRLGISLSVLPDGRLKAHGDTNTIQTYLADIAARYRGAIIAHLLNLPAPEVTDQQDSANILANAQALDVAITEYCATSGKTSEYRDRLLSVRRRMAPAYLFQNLCAFRTWLYAARQGQETRLP